MTRKRQHIAKSHNSEARPDDKMGSLHMPKRSASHGVGWSTDHGYVKPAHSAVRRTMKKIANAKRRRRDRQVTDDE